MNLEDIKMDLGYLSPQTWDVFARSFPTAQAWLLEQALYGEYYHLVKLKHANTLDVPLVLSDAEEKRYEELCAWNHEIVTRSIV